VTVVVPGPRAARPWARWLKIWVYGHVALTVTAAPALLGLAGYGLVHGNDRAVGGFMLVLLGAAAVVIAAPLSLLSPRSEPHFLVLKGVGLITLVAGTTGALLLLGYLVLEPQWLGWRFQRSMSGLRIASLQETPVLLHGHPSGLRVVLELEVPRPVQLDPMGMATVDLMHGLHVQASKHVSAMRLPSPFDNQGPNLITLDGKPLAELPGLAAALGSSRSTGDPNATLPAGLYRIERVFWLHGLDSASQATPNGGTPDPHCLKDYPDPARVDADLAPLQGAALKATLGTRYDLTQRRGYRSFTLDAPLKFVYRHTPLSELQALHPLPSCSAQYQKQRAQERVRRYLDGDNAELEAKLCAGDEAGVRAVLAMGAPKASVWPKLSPCTVEQPRGELFSLLMPYAYAQSQGHGEASRYCGLLAQLHNTGNLSYLSRLAALKLPLVCEADRYGEAEVWRNGFDPRMPSPRSGPRKPARELTDATQLEWLTLMKAQGLPICKPAANGSTLLQFSVLHRSAAVIEFLLDAGCDPHAPPPAKPVLDGGNSGLPARAEMQPILPVAGWTLRRFRTPDSRSTSPIDPERVAAITRRMGNLRADEINGVAPSRNAPFLMAFRADVLRNPALLHHLVQHGARLDATDAYGTSWFEGVADDSALGDPRDKPRERPFAMLDALSDAQMRELIRPGPKGLRQLADEHRTASTFNTYLCKRKLGPCAPLTR
jgi:hypothetical protein